MAVLLTMKPEQKVLPPVEMTPTGGDLAAPVVALGADDVDVAGAGAVAGGQQLAESAIADVHGAERQLHATLGLGRYRQLDDDRVAQQHRRPQLAVLSVIGSSVSAGAVAQIGGVDDELRGLGQGEAREAEVQREGAGRVHPQAPDAIAAGDVFPGAARDGADVGGEGDGEAGRQALGVAILILEPGEGGIDDGRRIQLHGLEGQQGLLRRRRRGRQGGSEGGQAGQGEQKQPSQGFQHAHDGLHSMGGDVVQGVAASPSRPALTIRTTSYHSYGDIRSKFLATAANMPDNQGPPSRSPAWRFPVSRSHRPALALALLLALAWQARTAAALPIELAAGAFDPATGGQPADPALRSGQPDADEQAHWIVQARKALTPALKAELRALGAELLGYLPQQAQLVRMTGAQAAAAAQLAEIGFVGLWHPAYALSPTIGQRVWQDTARAADGRLFLTVVLFAGTDAERVAAGARKLDAEILALNADPASPRLELALAPARLHDLARLAGVQWIEDAPEYSERNHNVVWIVQTAVNGNEALWDAGLHGENQVLSHIDSGMAESSCFFNDPDGDPIGPNHRKVLYQTGGTTSTHGTHTAGTAVGNQTPVSGVSDYNGVAYAAKMADRAPTTPAASTCTPRW